MKTKIIFLLGALFAGVAFAADASPAVLASSTKNGVTTLVTTGRVQAEAAVNADGTVTFTVFPNVTLLDSTGTPIAAPQLDTAKGFPVNLSAELVAKVLVEVKAAYLAKVAAEDAAKAAPTSGTITTTMQRAPAFSTSASGEFDKCLVSNITFFGNNRASSLTLTADGKAIYKGTPDEATAAFISALRPRLEQLYASAK